MHAKPNTIDSTSVMYINFLTEHNRQENDILQKIIIETNPVSKNKLPRHLTAQQIKTAWAFPYSNLKAVVAVKTKHLRLIDQICQQEEAFTQGLQQVDAIKAQLEILKKQAKSEDQTKITEKEQQLLEREHQIKTRHKTLSTLREKVGQSQQALAEKMEHHRQIWIQMRQTLYQEAVQLIEKHTGKTLTTHEKDQLKTIESLESMYERYKTLGISPAIPYEEAIKDSKSLLLLMCNLIHKEVTNRGQFE